MASSKTLTVLTCLIALLALLAAGVGFLYQGQGAAYDFTSVRGETVAIYGHGLYRFDPAFSAVQAVAQDIVTIVVGVPLLLVSLWLFRQGTLRGRLLVAGTLAYFLYTYTSMAFGIAFNDLFLVYVALFSLSLVALIMALLAIDVRTLPAYFGERLPRRAIAIFLLVCGVLVALLWLGRLAPAMGSTAPPAGLGTNTTLFIQVMDLGLVVPLLVVAGLSLWRRRPLGYLLSSVALIKLVTMGIALVAMLVGQMLAGVAVTAAEVVVFSALPAVGLLMAFLLLRSIREPALTQASS